jgi:two-component system, NarL family, sensor kinase
MTPLVRGSRALAEVVPLGFRRFSCTSTLPERHPEDGLSADRGACRRYRVLKRTDTSVARAVAMFALSGVVALVLVGLAGGVVLRDLGRSQAIREAENITVVTGTEVVQPRLTDGVLQRDSQSLLQLDSVVFAVLHDPIVRVKIWDTEGRILYSDVPELIDSSYPLDTGAQRALSIGDVSANPVDLSLPQNRFERGLGKLLEVTLPLETPDHHRLLFQAFLRSDSILTNARELWRAFLPVLALALLALTLLQIPLAYRLAHRVRRGQQEREQLLSRAIESGDVERRRIAADLHDGPVQQFAGLALTLAARAETLQRREPTAAIALRDAAAQTRLGMRTLRSTLVSVYPPSLGSAGLASAVSDLTSPLIESGIRCSVDIPEGLDLRQSTEALLFRVTQEAVRNIVGHSRAHEACVRVWKEARSVVLEVRDDGVGFSTEEQERAMSDGHMGLALLRDLTRDAQGSLRVQSDEGLGTTVRLEVPVG